MKIVLVSLIAMVPSAVFGQPATPAKPPPSITFYKTADSAACSGDVAVWLDPETRLYYLKGDKLFGKTRRGGFNCRRQADAAGYQPVKPR